MGSGKRGKQKMKMLKTSLYEIREEGGFGGY